MRRFLDSLELLALILEGVAAHAAEAVGTKEVEILRARIEGQWNDSLMCHFFPRTLLEFISERIPYEMLRTIFEVLRRNFRIGRSIPNLVGRGKSGVDFENYRKCLAALDCLSAGGARRFAGQAAELFQDIRAQIIAVCRKIGYWEAAAQVYDGTGLWR